MTSTPNSLLRPLTDSDTPIINEWIARDPDHSTRAMTADFFRQPDSLSFAIDDDAGPIMYIRIDPLNADMARLHIQFDEGQRRRTALALMREFPEVRYRISQTGMKYILFDSVSPSLISFCQKRFGFVRHADTDDYFLDLLPPIKD